MERPQRGKNVFKVQEFRLDPTVTDFQAAFVRSNSTLYASKDKGRRNKPFSHLLTACFFSATDKSEMPRTVTIEHNVQSFALQYIDIVNRQRTIWD